MGSVEICRVVGVSVGRGGRSRRQNKADNNEDKSLWIPRQAVQFPGCHTITNILRYSSVLKAVALNGVARISG